MHEPKVRYFYYNMEVLEEGGFRTTVKHVKIYLTEESWNHFGCSI